LVLVTNFRETTQSQKQNFPLSDALYIKMCTYSSNNNLKTFDKIS
jgi:hypothetical protein